MTFLLADLIAEYRNKIAAFTGVNVRLGVPDDSVPGLYLLPYYFSVDPTRRNSLPPGITTQTSTPFFVKCLLMASPSIDYVVLNKGLDYVSDKPSFEFDNGTVNVALESISTQELTSLLIGVGFTYRLSIPFELRYGE